jgi:N-acetylmuramic acid 6-phosphate etherase
LRIPSTGLLLGAADRIILKLALNALSTAVMARMGRVIGNCMACVTPTNKKLVDRATRYISHLGGVGEREARALLLLAMAHTAGRRQAGRDHPPVVTLAVTASRFGLSMPAAEARLRSGKIPD